MSTNISSQPLPALSNNPTQQLLAAIPLSCAPTNVPNLPPISNNPSLTVLPLSKTSNTKSCMYSFVRAPSYRRDNRNNIIAYKKKRFQKASRPCSLSPIMEEVEELPSGEEPRVGVIHAVQLCMNIIIIHVRYKYACVPHHVHVPVHLLETVI